MRIHYNVFRRHLMTKGSSQAIVCGGGGASRCRIAATKNVCNRITASSFSSSLMSASSSSSSYSYSYGSARRWMSNGSSSSSAQDELVDVLAREEQEEAETGNTDMPEELSSLQKELETNWRIVASDSDATVHMYSKLSTSPKIQVSFHCQDTVEEVVDNIDDYDDDDDEVDRAKPGAEEDEEEEEPMAAVRFTTTITKAGKTLTMACLSEFGQVKIEGISTCAGASGDCDPEIIHKNQGILDKSFYQGPEFSELAEDVQDSFGIYLEEFCGVNSDVAAYIAMMADYKEQMSYVAFLKDAQSIVKP